MFDRIVHTKFGALVKENKFAFALGLGGIAAILIMAMVLLIVFTSSERTNYRDAFALAEGLVAEGDYEQALAVYEEETGSDHYDPSFYMGFGKSLEDAGKYEEALAIYREGYKVTGNQELEKKVVELEGLIAGLADGSETGNEVSGSETPAPSANAQDENNSAKDEGEDRDPENDNDSKDDSKNDSKDGSEQGQNNKSGGNSSASSLQEVNITLYAATTNNKVKNAEVAIKSDDDVAVEKVKTNTSGTFDTDEILELEPGDYKAEISKSGFITEEFAFTVDEKISGVSDDSTAGDAADAADAADADAADADSKKTDSKNADTMQLSFTLCEKLKSNEKARIVLIWEEKSTDLDASFEGKMSKGASISVDQANKVAEISKGKNKETVTELYNDKKSGYASEVISVYNTDGTFTFSVTAIKKAGSTTEKNSSELWGGIGKGLFGNENTNGDSQDSEKDKKKSIDENKDISTTKPLVKVYTSNNKAPEIFDGAPEGAKGTWAVFTIEKGKVKLLEADADDEKTNNDSSTR